MFHITRALLAVLAISNVASTLADGDFRVNYTVRGIGDTISDPRFEYGKGSGCGGGSENKNCSCKLDAKGELVMIGKGTDGSATGLDFFCFFTVGESTCSIQVDIPYSGTNHLRCICSGYTFYGCDIPDSGHDFTKTMVVIPDNLQLDDPGCNSPAPSTAPPSPAPSERPLLAQCDLLSDDKKCKIKKKQCAKTPESMKKCKKKCNKDAKKKQLCQMTCCKVDFITFG